MDENIEVYIVYNGSFVGCMVKRETEKEKLEEKKNREEVNKKKKNWQSKLRIKLDIVSGDE
ncbi:hypothetical protein Scep_018604 [Stephania cephalantha]|uniref:Uncharacterized protein n=1 Tax=Stephania cephalantha TaxID=152367 RepID=A0AAP0NMC3_9MAGN